ncbi:MAG: lysozyme [Bacteroidetes bacterium]|nr:lysozyme [Bacteroidota bacterium]
MDISKQGTDLIKEFEGFRDKAYKCPAGVWTIGYGHTLGVQEGDVITKAEGQELLLCDLRTAISAVNSLVTVQLSQSQFDALVSFVFNIGIGAFVRSTLLKVLNNCQYEQVPHELKRWNKSNGKVLAGLVRRREAEAQLFERIK